MASHVECIQQANAILGEGPLWDWRTGDLFWIDIRRQQIFRHNLKTGRQTGQWATSERIGCVALTSQPDTLLVAAGLTVSQMDLATGDFTLLADLSAGRPGQRFNDGKVDAAGRLWVGTMLDDFLGPERFDGGGLHRIDPDGTVTYFGEYLLPNGIGWTTDNKSMIFSDTVAASTYAFDFDVAAGTATNRRTIHRFEPEDGGPDGLTIDADDNIWSAMWDGWCLIKLSQEGEELERIQMPVRRPSSVTFGGENLDQMLITSATVDFTSADYLKSPQAGGLFAMRCGVTGKRENLFGLNGADSQ
ncbi:MAG: SMP-30/gluconolactonase/LRE family protein [Hyphomicrobiaceae bacterium]|nr:SMP-30/gluconolactonase/LRE family protein [Hyphomicrobiaceae bacterium]